MGKNLERHGGVTPKRRQKFFESLHVVQHVEKLKTETHNRSCGFWWTPQQEKINHPLPCYSLVMAAKAITATLLPVPMNALRPEAACIK
jgi:hypothetical protein